MNQSPIDTDDPGPPPHTSGNVQNPDTSGRDGSPSRLQAHAQKSLTANGRLGEASLPPPSKTRPVRKWLGHAVPNWVDHGIFFITINCRQRGAQPLLDDAVASTIRDSSLIYHEKRWWIHLWLIMPDHLHALLSFPHNESMINVVGDWKRFVSRTTGIDWQKGFFDHRLRKEESFDEKAHYIRMNPVRKDLVTTPDQWPYVWSFDGRGSDNNAGMDAPGRDGSPSRPHAQPETSSTTHGRLGEASLPSPPR
jgi:putative transposase